MWRKLWMVSCLFVVLFHGQGFAAGLASNKNFIVLSPPVPSQAAAQRFAEKIAEEANDLRKKISTDWLGEPLPDRIGRTTVNVQFSDEPDSALTWAKDKPNRRFHSIYLKTPQSETVALGLAHEVAHAVLATKFPHPNRLPAWVEEAIACRYDDETRIRKRNVVLASMVRTRNWPNLESILTAKNISSRNASAYAVSCSVADYLLSKGDKSKFLEFAEHIPKNGLGNALQRTYEITGTADLETRWQKWVVKRQPHPPAGKFASYRTGREQRD